MTWYIPAWYIDIYGKVYLVEVKAMYRMFNPYQHMSRSFILSADVWARIAGRLAAADLENIENGGRVKIGAAAVVWKIGK